MPSKNLTISKACAENLVVRKHYKIARGATSRRTQFDFDAIVKIEYFAEIIQAKETQNTSFTADFG